MTTDQKLMTVKEVAHFLRLSLAETYRLVNTKSLTHFRVGPGRGAIRISQNRTCWRSLRIVDRAVTCFPAKSFRRVAIQNP
jgi:excisionase family DNA binding protein